MWHKLTNWVSDKSCLSKNSNEHQTTLKQGCHRSWNGHGKQKFSKVREKSGNCIPSHRKILWIKVSENVNLNSIQIYLYQRLTGRKFQMTVISAIISAEWIMEAVIVSSKMVGKDGHKGRLYATTTCDFYLFGQGNLAFIREKSGSFENWSLYLCSNNVN